MHVPDVRLRSNKVGQFISRPPAIRCHGPVFKVRRVHVMTILALATSTTPATFLIKDLQNHTDLICNASFVLSITL